MPSGIVPAHNTSAGSVVLPSRSLDDNAHCPYLLLPNLKESDPHYQHFRSISATKRSHDVYFHSLLNDISFVPYDPQNGKNSRYKIDG